MAAVAGPPGARKPTGLSVDAVVAPLKPMFRGVSHQYAFFMSLSAGAVMVASAPTAKARLAAAVYTTSMSLLFGVSALYHRGKWGPTAHLWMRRADHAAIFMLIAGTYTPVCMLALAGHHGHPLLSLMWSIAVLGIMQALFWVSAPRPLIVSLYLCMGWMAVLYADEFRQGLGTVGVAWVATGGVCYSVGAIIYALHWPNPSPKFFGFHEIFHAFTIMASVCHFVAVYTLVHASKMIGS